MLLTTAFHRGLWAVSCFMFDISMSLPGFQHVAIPGARLSRTARYRRVAADLQWAGAHVARKV